MPPIEKKVHRVPFTAFSSLLLFIPGIYAYYHGVMDVFASSFLCTLTSTAHHAHECRDEILRKVDRTVVRVISIAYVLHALLYLNVFSQHVLMLLVFGAITALLYVRFAMFYDNEDVHEMHVMIHACAVLGMMQYINARLYSRT